jgi:hypothetical protein
MVPSLSSAGMQQHAAAKETEVLIKGDRQHSDKFAN